MSKTVSIMRDEWSLFGALLPYIPIVSGAFLALCLAVSIRLGIMAQFYWRDTPVSSASWTVTWFVIVSCVVLTAICWYLFSQMYKRKSGVREHATVTVILLHLWLCLAIWEASGEWLFGPYTWYTYVFGGLIVALSWVIRRWANRDDYVSPVLNSKPFQEAGLGNSRISKREGVPGGVLYRMELPIGTTSEDVRKKKVEIAQIARVTRSRVHIYDTDDESVVNILILDSGEGFGQNWDSPDFAGDSIVKPVTYATYDTGDRPELYLAGKDGGSSQHWLTVGVSGSGKSKAWQAIYGSVLTRHDVSVVFGDPAKGMQTGGPLAGGLEWFETTERGCMRQISAVLKAIPVRTNYLTSRGLDCWSPDCGLNLVIFHLEEAARFAEVEELVQLTEAARSAGIVLVVSLQKGTADRIKTAARYNLGGNMCFGVKMKRDAAFGLSEYALAAGAAPHRWQDKFPGMHYLEAHGIDNDMVGHAVKTDWVDPILLESIIDENQSHRRGLDTVTASAFGKPYADYRKAVENGSTTWQQLRRHRGFDKDTVVLEPVQVAPRVLPTEETAAAKQHLADIIEGFRKEGKTVFTIKDVIDAGFTAKSDSTIRRWLKKLVEQGVLTVNFHRYSIVSSVE